MTTKTRSLSSGLRGAGALSAAVAAILIAGGAISTHAQDLSAAGAAPLAVQGISQPGKFPIKITKPGSYKLNGNLTVKTAGADAIDVNVSNVTIDLSGFTITGGVIAINGLTAGATNTTVTNGIITGSSAGILLAEGGVVRGVHVISLTATGSSNCGAIKCVDHCTISGNVIDSNSVCSPAGAITVGGNSLISDNSVNGTVGGPGILVGATGGTIVSGNTANGNSGDGIEVEGPGVLVSHNTASNNAVGVSFGVNPGAYMDNVLLNNTTDTQGGTSSAGGNTNLCTGGVC
jgi:parallel beta-helix repeat protein